MARVGFILILACLLAGCIAKPSGDTDATGCGMVLTPERPDPRQATEIPSRVLEEHPKFKSMVEQAAARSPEGRGASMSIGCPEGTAIMDALESEGATLRHFDGVARDAMFLIAEAPYQVLLSAEVTD